MSTRRCDSDNYTLLSNGAATGSAVGIKGGQYTFFVEGTVAGATLALQMQSLNGTWMTVQVFSGSAVSFTALPGCQTGIDLPAGNVRLFISGGPPSAVYAFLVGLG